MELDLDCNIEADEENQSSSNSKPATSLPTSQVIKTHNLMRIHDRSDIYKFCIVFAFQMACVVMIQICEAVNSKCH